MTKQTLYLKYRPQKIDELDLAEVRASLKKIVSSGIIPHAFLFSGPKGTGKTSAARILAKIVNCEKPKGGEPCNTCAQCVSITNGSNIDVVEIDAASNRGIDDIRILRESIALSPALAKKKIYIVDEVHMLTTEAANAFLKTLEEPPEHAMFILATTNPEKLPGTLRSRTTLVSFKKAKVGEIERQLERVAKGEKIKLAKDVLEEIAKVSDGSFRDAVKITEQLMAGGKTPAKEEVWKLSSGASESGVKEFIGFLEERELKKSLRFIEELAQSGADIKSFIQKVLEVFHESLLAKEEVEGKKEQTNFSKTQLISLIELFSDSLGVRVPSLPQLGVELAVISWGSETKSEEQNTKPEASGKKKVLKNKKRVSDAEFSKDSWKALLLKVGEKNTSIEALLRASTPLNYDGEMLHLGVFYQFHKEQLEVDKNRRLLEEAAMEVLGGSVRVHCELTQKPSASLTEAVDEDIMKAAEEIFG